MLRPFQNRKAPKPLDPALLRALALHYVGRYATTEGKLRQYLERKLRERGWSGEAAPDLAALAVEFSGLGYVDDKGFARNRGESLKRRGYGPRRIRANLQAAGISGELAGEAANLPEDDRLNAALVFARKRRLGPFDSGGDDPKKRQRAFASLIRAGHDPDIAGKLLRMELGAAESLLS